MLHTLKLLLPALLPSWRFFAAIAPSPRVQFVLLNPGSDASKDWQEFRPPPARLSFLAMLKRMLWNPVWNESLFLVSCAERLMEEPTTHSEDEILKRITAELQNNPTYLAEPPATHLQFRLLVIKRSGTRLHQQVVFHSRIQPLPKRETA